MPILGSETKLLISLNLEMLVRTGPGKPGKSWNFIMAFSWTGKRPVVLKSSGNLLNSTKNMKCMEGSKEN